MENSAGHGGRRLLIAPQHQCNDDHQGNKGFQQQQQGFDGNAFHNERFIRS